MDIDIAVLLNFPNITVKNRTYQSNGVYLNLRLLNEKASSLVCQKTSSEIHQSRSNLTRDLSIFG